MPDIEARDFGLKSAATSMASFNPGNIDRPMLWRRLPSHPTISVDVFGAEGNCSDWFSLIEDAISFVQDHAADIPDTMIQNTAGAQGDECLSMRNTRVFAGIAQRYLGMTSPREIVNETLFSGNIRVAIDCKDVGCDQAAATPCGQWNDRVKNIHLCKRVLRGVSATDFAEVFGCIIVHEIMHVWGADEPAAETVEVWDRCI